MILQDEVDGESDNHRETVMEFKEGDRVRLKSGGPTMTVEEVYDEDLSCVWFDKVGNKQVVQRGSFRPVVLEAAPKPGAAFVSLVR